MICIECTHPVSSLYTSYSPTNIRMTACPNCNKFADKYIEHDGVVIVIDLLLLKPQAYRHVVFNVLSSETDDSLHTRTKRMWLLITLFDVYLTWARAEKSSTQESALSSSNHPVNAYILSLPVLVQYLIFLIYCITDTFVVHLTLRSMAQHWLHWTRPNALSTAVLISSSSKLFPILMLIWSYDIPIAATMVSWAVDFNIVEALTTILRCGYWRATFMVVIAELARIVVCEKAISWAILWFANQQV